MPARYTYFEAVLQEGLEFLAFQNVGCSINACAAVKELFANPAQLKGFHFYNNMSDDEGAASIAEVRSSSNSHQPSYALRLKSLPFLMQAVRLPASQEAESCPLVAQILSRAPAILDFKMASSRVGAAGGTALARGLKAGAALDTVAFAQMLRLAP